MVHSRGEMPGTGRVNNTPNNSPGAEAKSSNVSFITERARQLSAKEGARRAGMTPKGFQKLQAGECSISFDKLTYWCQSDTDFAAAYAAHVGLILPGEVGYVGALTRAVNEAALRRGQRERADS